MKTVGTFAKYLAKTLSMSNHVGPRLASSLVAFVLFFGVASKVAAQTTESPPLPTSSTAPVANEDVGQVIRQFHAIGETGDDSLPKSPQETLASMTLQDDLKIEVVAAEPDVMQPVSIYFDPKGRMWVVQYLQYPFPAGLKVVRYDQFLRAVFDKVPSPPPHHDPGKDKISVFEDRDKDGIYETSKTVLDGLNITTSVLTGYGGIWVLNPPYLLFYPDADGDDIPDRAPEVCLSGFGIEDTHAIANSLTWGPDGWIYGSMGSTTTAKITSAKNKDVRFEGQCVWRYHPEWKVFEVFAEGGGNTFSLEFDGAGRAFSGTNIGEARGMYYPQGSYGEKNFGKHGPLTNDAAFGYFKHMKHQGDPLRFPQTFVVYEGGTLPERFHGSVIAANALHNRVWSSELLTDGSTYQTKDQPVICLSEDKWFRPVDLKVGPEGAVYLADWYDTRLTHIDPRDNWHKTSGRVYRIQGKEATPNWQNDLTAMSDSELVELLDHPNKWHRQTAVRLLAERCKKGDGSSTSVIPELRNLMMQDTPRALEALWASYQTGQMVEAELRKLLHHPQADVRRWAVRFLGDTRNVTSQTATALQALAEREAEVQVLSQLASSAKRFSTPTALPILRCLMTNDVNAKDPHLPLLIWWGIEAHCGQWIDDKSNPHIGIPLDSKENISPRDLVMQFFEDRDLWAKQIVRDTIGSRLMRRFAQQAAMADQSDDAESMAAYAICEKLFSISPDNMQQSLMAGFLDSHQGRSLDQLPTGLRERIMQYQESIGKSDLVLGVQLNDQKAIHSAIKLIMDDQAELAIRLTLIETFGTYRIKDSVSSLQGLLKSSSSGIKIAALHSLSNFADEKIGKQICNGLQSSLSAETRVQENALRVLASRPEWSLLLVSDVEGLRFAKENVPLDIVQQMRFHTSAPLQSRLDKLWGPPSESQQETQREMDRIRTLLTSKPITAGSQSALINGEKLFQTNCANCHTLFSKGGVIGPDLTGYERTNLDFMLLAIINPSAGIREEYTQFQLITTDGRVLSGVITDRDATSVTLRDVNNHLTTVPRVEIDLLQAVPLSAMPDSLLKRLSDQEVVDLFSYLMQPAGEVKANKQ